MSCPWTPRAFQTFLIFNSSAIVAACMLLCQSDKPLSCYVETRTAYIKRQLQLKHSHGLLDSRLIFLYFITKHNSDFFSLQTMNFKYVERKLLLSRVWYESLWKQHINTPKILFLFIFSSSSPLYKKKSWIAPFQREINLIVCHTKKHWIKRNRSSLLMA